MISLPQAFLLLLLLPSNSGRLTSGWCDPAAAPRPADTCGCNQSQDINTTHVGDDCQVGAPCVAWTKTTSGTAHPGKCHKDEVTCSAQAIACAHQAYTVTVTIAACASGIGGTFTCCPDTRPDPNPGAGCMTVKLDGSLLDTKCAGESIKIPIGAPPNQGCGAANISNVIAVECASDGDLELEVTATFRCPQCKAKS